VQSLLLQKGSRERRHGRKGGEGEEEGDSPSHRKNVRLPERTEQNQSGEKGKGRGGGLAKKASWIGKSETPCERGEAGEFS